MIDLNISLPEMEVYTPFRCLPLYKLSKQLCIDVEGT